MKMMIYKCDRCGAISEKTMHPDWRRYIIRDESTNRRIMDLCENCYQALVDFIITFDDKEVEQND